MTQIKKGDIVKSLDFNGIDNTYMIGEVVSVSAMDRTLRARAIKRVFNGTAQARRYLPDYFVVSLQGQVFMDTDAAPRITVIG